LKLKIKLAPRTIPILKLPTLYPIIDFSCFTAQPDPITAIVRYAEELIAAGATLIQLRDKYQPGFEKDVAKRFLSCARELRRVTWDTGTTPRATLIINDRIDICLAADADGVHLGQNDLSPTAARRIFDSVLSHPNAQSLGKSQLLRERMGHPEDRSHRERMGHDEGLAVEQRETTRKLLIGVSTHNLSQVIAADALPIDYIAIGPVFATGSKANPDAVVGLEGVRQARRVTKKPLVAIGGITRQNCSQVKDLGADVVAVISDLLESPGKAVADFLRVLR
jgi:thiamine-phosphate pyrophosphorylase